MLKQLLQKLPMRRVLEFRFLQVDFEKSFGKPLRFLQEVRLQKCLEKVAEVVLKKLSCVQMNFCRKMLLKSAEN